MHSGAIGAAEIMMGTEAGIAEGDKIGTRDRFVDGNVVRCDSGKDVVTGEFVTSKMGPLAGGVAGIVEGVFGTGTVGAAAGEVVDAGTTGVVTGEDVTGREIGKGCKIGLVVEVGV